jgi:UDP-N-acetyl-D-mannosaminuronic acid transferase (WecB/TagA/CpsF family)
MEWVYRLYREPRRLWRRYLIGNFLFLGRIYRQLLTGRGSRA